MKCILIIYIYICIIIHIAHTHTHKTERECVCIESRLSVKLCVVFVSICVFRQKLIYLYEIKANDI